MTRAGELVGLGSLLAGLVAVLAAGVGFLTLVVGGGGFVILVAARLSGSRTLATAGAVGLFCAVVLAALAGVGLAPLLVAGAATMLAGTFGHSAIELQESLGSAPSRDLEIAHVAGTVALVSGAALAAYLAASVRLSGISPLAVVVLLVAAVALTAALRP
jgi:hypothetical protein